MSLEKRKSALRSIGTPVTKTTTTSKNSIFNFRTRATPSFPLSPVIDTRRRSRSLQNPVLPTPIPTPAPSPSTTYFQVDIDGTSYFSENYFETE